MLIKDLIISTTKKNGDIYKSRKDDLYLLVYIIDEKAHCGWSDNPYGSPFLMEKGNFDSTEEVYYCGNVLEFLYNLSIKEGAL